ncbi:thioesterase family protein [Lysobacter enzymogenes]|uniref:thioesterase family protein n=1 Tax=Lysobacter enzymogenes TaxID=69 RepID=UPI00384AB9FA
MLSFSELIETFEPDSEILPPPQWFQGRTVYGGLTAALALRAAVRAAPLGLPPLRAAQVAFVGPASGALRFQARVLRQGKSSLSADVEASSDGEPALRALFVFAQPRPSRIAHDFSQRPTVRPPAECPRLPMHELAPRFLGNFDVRLAGGSAPASGAANPEFVAWVRHLDDSGVDPDVSLVALADALPPAALASFTQMAPVSSIVWNFEVLAAPTARRWFLLRSFSQHAAHGCSVQDMEIWDESGQRVLTGRQSVALYQ